MIIDNTMVARKLGHGEAGQGSKRLPIRGGYQGHCQMFMFVVDALSF